MNFRESFQSLADRLIGAEPAGSSDRGNRITCPADFKIFNGARLAKFRLSLLIGAALFASGVCHLTLLWITGADWSGPLSLRKPGLFGISAGVTVWSMAWVLTQFTPRNSDPRLANFMSCGLLLEVGLITLQQWRGVPSHFNRATIFDATIETTMLGVILLVTVGIAWLYWRSLQVQDMLASCAFAIRAGLWFLLVSCGLGLLATIAGEVNLANGRPPEIWGCFGILKYPHGATLHAIQTLPLLSMLLQKLRVAHADWLLRLAVAAQGLFLAHTLWQTAHGRSRMDVDAIGGATLAVSGLLLLPPLIAIVRGIALSARKIWSDTA